MAAAKVDEVYIFFIYLKHQKQKVEQKGQKLKMMVMQSETLESINLLKTKHRLLYLKTQFVPCSKQF